MVISIMEKLIRVRVELTGNGSADACKVIFSSPVTYSVKGNRNTCVAYLWVNDRDITHMKQAVNKFEGLTIQITNGTEVL